MPKAPITARTLYWELLDDGVTKQVLDWCLVTTSLGDMVEPRLIAKQSGNMKNEDLVDSGYSDIVGLPRVPTGNYALDQATVSSQWPHYRSTEPGGID